MATGFMVRLHSILLCLGLGAAAAQAADVSLIGVIGNKAAVLAIDGGEPKTVKVGQRWNGIAVVSVEKSQAVVEIDGVKRTLALGQHYRSGAGGGSSSGRDSVTLAPSEGGHFMADGSINGVAVRFVVDTGASYIALPGAQAQAMGIDYRRAPRGSAQTANGEVTAYRVRFDTVRVGNIEVNAVDGIVIEQGLPVALLGMSFLNRVDMRREGDRMTLLKRF
ncbi:MAG TPA: TIGR02281 family clan AA aspartic protease [Burkholderiales bacterium]|nr:TIGR02281 family clan AA aspartic protease [Burkholderiales bacterium]